MQAIKNMEGRASQNTSTRASLWVKTKRESVAEDITVWSFSLSLAVMSSSWLHESADCTMEWQTLK